MEKLHQLKSTLEKELDKLAGKGSMSGSDLENIFKLVMAIKGIYKIKMYEEEDGYSQDGGMWRAEGGYSDRRGRRNGRGMSYEDNSYARGDYSGESYAQGGYSERRRRDARGRYSREGYSMHDAKGEIVEEIQELMEMEGLEHRDREVLRKAMEQLSR